MTINDIYETALYLAEKTDDDTGIIDSEYKKQHQKKAEVIIRQAIRKFAFLNNENIPDPDVFKNDEEIPLLQYPLKNIIPRYVAAMLCAHDKEMDKYSLLIYEYTDELEQYKKDEEQLDIYDAMMGMEG